MTAKALATAAGVAPLTVTRLEKGKNSAPSLDTVTSFSNVLGYPVEFFYGQDLCDLNRDNVSFRSMSAMSAAEREAAIAAGQLGVLLMNNLGACFNLPCIDLPSLEPGLSPEVASRLLRQHWGIGDRPIPALIRLLEAKGIRVLSLHERNLRVDAFSFWWNGDAYMFLNNQKSAERMLYDAAHELGHLLLHRQVAPKDTRAGEKEANDFAAAFMMPEADVRAHRPRGISPASIIQAKRRWRVSAMALTYRLHSLGLLTDWQSRSLYVTLGQMGYRTGEPEGIDREVSSLWPLLLGELWRDGKTREHIAEEIELPKDEVFALIDGLLGSQPVAPRGSFKPVLVQ